MGRIENTSSLSEKNIETLAKLIYQKVSNEEKENQYASAKTVLSLLGMGITLAAVFLVPRAASIMAKDMWKKDNEWNKKCLYYPIPML